MTTDVDSKLVLFREGGELGGPASIHAFVVIHDWDFRKTRVNRERCNYWGNGYCGEEIA